MKLLLLIFFLSVYLIYFLLQLPDMSFNNQYTHKWIKIKDEKGEAKASLKEQRKKNSKVFPENV